MDHHCPWVANCIGFYNYKFFMNMLFHTSFCCFLTVTTSYPVLQHALRNPEAFDYKCCFFVMTAFVLASLIGFIITSFMSFHLYLISKELTTLEFCEKRSKDEVNCMRSKQPYNRGMYLNLCNILGYNPFLWFIPFCKYF